MKFTSVFISFIQVWMCLCDVSTLSAAPRAFVAMGRPYCPACPLGTARHRVKSKCGACPNKTCINYVKFRRGPRKNKMKNMGMDKNAKVAMALLREALDDRDENGQRIVALKYRLDVGGLKDAVTLLRVADLSLPSIIFLAGFLHILYWPWPTMTAVTMFLACTTSNRIRCWCALDRARAGVYLIDIGEKLHEMYEKVCCREGQALMLRTEKKMHTGTFPNPTMNPMMRRGSKQQWQDLVDDVKKDGWQQMCQTGARLVQDGIRNGEACVSYRGFFDHIAKYSFRLYSATSTAAASHYNTVHFIRSFLFALGLHSDQSSADWDLLNTMGSGVRESKVPVKTHEIATYCSRQIGFLLNEPYGVEDLGCFICLMKKRDD